MRDQAGDEHGGPPWFKEESSPAGWRELLRARGDERDGSLSHREAVSFKQRFLEFRQPSMPAKLFVWVQFTTKTEPTANDLLVLVKTRSQRNAVVQPLAARLGITLLFLPSPTL